MLTINLIVILSEKGCRLQFKVDIRKFTVTTVGKLVIGLVSLGLV